jgi:hypothetical protein
MALVASTTAVAATPVDELAALKSRMATLRDRDLTHRSSLEGQWAKFEEQDRFYREAEQRQASMDTWSQQCILETMSRQSAQIQDELAADREVRASRLRLPPVPAEVQEQYDSQRRDKVSRIRETEQRRSTKSITDHSPTRAPEQQA